MHINIMLFQKICMYWKTTLLWSTKLDQGMTRARVYGQVYPPPQFTSFSDLFLHSSGYEKEFPFTSTFDLQFRSLMVVVKTCTFRATGTLLFGILLPEGHVWASIEGERVLWCNDTQKSLWRCLRYTNIIVKMFMIFCYFFISIVED